MAQVMRQRRPLRVLIAAPDRAVCERAAGRVDRIDGFGVGGIFPGLTGLFDAVERHPPHLVLIAPVLAGKPEFEMMEMLLRTLRVRWMPLAARRGALAPRTGADIAGLDIDADDATLQAALLAGLSADGPSAPVASTGLLRAVGGTANRLILIGSSTGGIDALLRVLSGFPPDCPPTLIVQHTGSQFAAGLARLLDRNVAPAVREARPGDRPARGTVLMAPGQDAHLTLDTRSGLQCRLSDGARISGHRPSVDALFHSAVPVARRVTAAILTGMGKDGGAGLLALRQAGAHTIGQDQATSLVYGMPRHAAELGAVAATLPLGAIGPALLGNGLRAVG